ncbi:MAG TPA: ferritin family protein [Planctomycetota bacterium]|nr:ferritin family protein [Planctomycetota bacterium]
MSAVFNADEIFAMAEQIERNGAKFYRKAAGGAAGESGKDMLLGLAAMEDDHEKTFAAMRKELTDQEQASAVFDPDDQAALYLQAVADGHVFDTKVDPSAKLTGRETLAEILTTAIGLEKDSIVFYIGMKDAVGRALGKEKIDGIIREEMSHVSLLSGELAKAS